MTRNEFLFIATLILPMEVFAQTEVITLESQVKGNQEQPTVLNIVPWKEANDHRRIDSGFETDMGRLFQHLDKEEFARQQYFHRVFLEIDESQGQQTNIHTSN